MLDSFALLAYLKKESQYEKVKTLLSSDNILLLMNEINTGETYYILARERGIEQAEYFINTILPSLPIEILPNMFQDIIEAAKIKAQYALAFADCFVVATAVREQAPIVTGDPEFQKIQRLTEIEWM